MVGQQDRTNEHGHHKRCTGTTNRVLYLVRVLYVYQVDHLIICGYRTRPIMHIIYTITPTIRSLTILSGRSFRPDDACLVRRSTKSARYAYSCCWEWLVRTHCSFLLRAASICHMSTERMTDRATDSDRSSYLHVRAEGGQGVRRVHGRRTQQEVPLLPRPPGELHTSMTSCLGAHR